MRLMGRRGQIVKEILEDRGPLKWKVLKGELEAREGRELHPEIVRRALSQAGKWNRVKEVGRYYFLPKQKVQAYDLASEPHPDLSLERIVARKEVGTGLYAIARIKNEGDLRARDCMVYVTISNDEVISEGQTVWESGVDKIDLFPGKAKGVLLFRIPEEMPDQLHVPIQPRPDAFEGFEYRVLRVGEDLNEDYILTLEVDSSDFPPLKRWRWLNEILGKMLKEN